MGQDKLRIMSENAECKQEQPLANKWGFFSLCAGNLILAFLFLLAVFLSPVYRIDVFVIVFYTMLPLWFICGVILFFRNKLAWFGSLLGSGTTACSLTWGLTHLNPGKNHWLGTIILAVLVTLCVAVFIGLLKMRKALK